MNKVVWSFVAGGALLGVCSVEVASAASTDQAPSSAEMQRMNARIRQLEANQKRLEAKAQKSRPEEKGSDWIMKGHDGRLKFETRDGRNELRLEGRVQLDSTVSSNDPASTGGDSTVGNTHFRRARIRVRGVIDKDWEYRLQYELTGGGGIKDAYLGYTGFVFNLFGQPAHSEILVGNQHVAFGFHVSSKHRDFLEDPAANNTFRPGRELGISYRAWQKHWNFWTSFTGGYGPGDAPPLGNKQGGTSQYTGSARLTINVINDQANTRVLQIGNSVAYRGITNHRNVTYNRFRTRPAGSHGFDERLIDTGHLENLSDEVIYSPNLTFQQDRFDFEGRYYRTYTRLDGANNPTFTGWSAQAGFFLTAGDHRPFSSDSASFGRVHPVRPLDEGGIGAFLLAARGEHVDLTDAGVEGGKLTDAVVALNWWPLNDIRFQLQYVNTLQVDGGPHHGEEPQIYAARVQYDF